MIEHATVLLTNPREADSLVHRAFIIPGENAMPDGMVLVPCQLAWISSNQYSIVGTTPTCVRCVAARRP